MKGSLIFIVEDERIIAKDISDSLTSLGYGVAGTASFGEDAIVKVGEHRPDLVLMDIMLQGKLDGIETADVIRMQYGIPVIYLTAFADNIILERAKITEPFGYIIKPYEDTELHFTIEMALYKHKMDAALKESREQLQALIETAGAIPWELDTRTKRFTYVGPQSNNILGYPSSAWTDIDFWGSLIHADDRKRATESYKTDSPAEEHREIEYRMLTASGKTVWIRDIINVIRHPDEPPVLRGFMFDITAKKEAEIERERLIAELKEALTKIKTLHGLLPICAWCKKIRDDQGYWSQVEEYLQEHSDAQFTHGMCPDCQVKLDKELSIYKKKP